jgi:hypothetical protein
LFAQQAWPAPPHAVHWPFASHTFDPVHAAFCATHWSSAESQQPFPLHALPEQHV